MHYETYSEYKKRVAQGKQDLAKKDAKAPKSLLREAPTEYTTDYNQKDDILTIYFLNGDQQTVAYKAIPDVWCLANLAGDIVGIYITQVSTQDKDYLGTIPKELRLPETQTEFLYSVLGKVNKDKLGNPDEKVRY